MTLISINSWQYDIYTFNIFVHVTVGIRCQSQSVTIPVGGLVLCENTCTIFVDRFMIWQGCHRCYSYLQYLKSFRNALMYLEFSFCVLIFLSLILSCLKISFTYGRGFLKHIAVSNRASACVSLMLFCVGQMKNEVNGGYPSYRFNHVM